MNRPVPPADPFAISVETIAAAWPMLGHRLDSRAPLRARQELALTRRFIESSAVPLADAEQELDFTCAPLDILVERHNGETKFHIIELNGTGIGGVSNMPAPVVGPMLASLTQIASTITEHDAVVLLGISGKEDDGDPRLNHLMHEKLMFAEAIQRGLELNLMNALDHFGVYADLSVVRPMNTCFAAGSDKAIAYEVINRVVRGTAAETLVPGLDFEVTHDRAQLMEAAKPWLKLGRRFVIKPHGTGIGHGIEFFLDPSASERDIALLVDLSIDETAMFYRIRGGAFPYTLCTFVDTPVIELAEHPLRGHKFECRVVVYRDGPVLRAFPSVAKIASQPFDASKPSRASLINNITASSQATKKGGVSFSLPLSNHESLETLGISVDIMEELSLISSTIVWAALDDLRVHPERHGLTTPPSAWLIAQ